MKSLARYSGAFIVLILLQLIIFSNIEFSGYVNPYVYVMFILILPFSIPSWFLLILAFFTGLVVDLFSGTLGVHAFATVMAGFVRPWILTLNITSEVNDPDMSPSLYRQGFRWFLFYTVTVVFVHHLSLFLVEVFTFSNFFHTLMRVLLSTVVTSFFIILFDFIRPRR